MTIKLWGLVLGTALTQLACGGAPEDAPVAEGSEQGHGRLVYSLTINEGHKIDFYEYDIGTSGTHETFPVGETEALRLPDDQPRTLSQLFKLVRPDDDVPEVLELADERVLVSRELMRERFAVDPNYLTALAEREALESRESLPSGQRVGKVSEAAIACSGDFYGDQWGAAWFRQNFGWGFSNGVTCPPAPRNVASFSDQGTITNAFSSNARHHSSRILQWKQMEGDFTNAGRTKGFWVNPGATSSGSVMWDWTVAPRTVSIATLNPGNFGNTEWYATGVSPCSHLHRTIVWCTGS
jgi:hypothetical protein